MGKQVDGTMMMNKTQGSREFRGSQNPSTIEDVSGLFSNDIVFTFLCVATAANRQDYREEQYYKH